VRKLACILAVVAAGACPNPLRASSHREAPLISQDLLADNTDVYTGDLGSGVHQLSTDGIRAFAGPRDDPFFVDLGATFDLLQLRTLNGKTGSAVDGLGNYNSTRTRPLSINLLQR
jgi:uncharacterized protein DUF4331